MKSEKDVVIELVDLVFDFIDKNSGGQKIMFMPALNLLKMKMANLDNDAAESIIDMVHKISHHIEIETGKFSPYHVD